MCLLLECGQVLGEPHEGGVVDGVGAGDEVEDLAPENYLVPGVRPGYRHVSDRTALCPVMTAAGYRPAEPVEHQAGA